MADDWGALVACSVISINAFMVLKSSAYDVTDRAVAPELRDSIRAAAA
jgi:divalent metal cation (Fe/Co/Zn/Cd) transporter